MLDGIIKTVKRDWFNIKLLEDEANQVHDKRYRCPYCQKKTFYKPVIGGFRCLNCKRFLRAEDLNNVK